MRGVFRGVYLVAHAGCRCCLHKPVNTTLSPLLGDGVGKVLIVVTFSWPRGCRRPGPSPNPSPEPTPSPGPASSSVSSPLVLPVFVSSLPVSPSSAALGGPSRP
jgi:hypothetical protein